jgi:hypothetical protein
MPPRGNVPKFDVAILAGNSKMSLPRIKLKCSNARWLPLHKLTSTSSDQSMGKSEKSKLWAESGKRANHKHEEKFSNTNNEDRYPNTTAQIIPVHCIGDRAGIGSRWRLWKIKNQRKNNNRFLMLRPLRTHLISSAPKKKNQLQVRKELWTS